MDRRPLNILLSNLENIIATHFEQRCHHGLAVRNQARTNVPKVSMDALSAGGFDEQGDGCIRLHINVEDQEEREQAVLNGLLELISFFHGHDMPPMDPYVVTDIVFVSARLERCSAETETVGEVKGTAIFNIFYVYDN